MNEKPVRTIKKRFLFAEKVSEHKVQIGTALGISVSFAGAAMVAANTEPSDEESSDDNEY